MRIQTIAILGAIAVTGATACTDITALEQVNPGQVSASTLYIPSNAQLLVNGAISDFECAFTRYVMGSATLMDEVSNAIGSTANFDYDARRLTSGASYGTGQCGANQQMPIYTTLSTARGSADTVLARLREWTDAEMPTGVNRTRLIGQAAAYAGYSLLLLGEGMCTASVNLSPEMTPAQLFDEAKGRFDSSIESATTVNDSVTLRFALLGRARTLLNLKQPAAAGTDAARIPVGFVAATGTDAVNLRRQNMSFLQINQNSQATVDASFRGLQVNGVNDPRVAVTNTGRVGTAVGSQIWTPDKYPALTTVTPIARYDLAQLIIAEAAVAANDLPGAVAAINRARATAPVVAAFDGTGLTGAQIQAQIVEERRRELFLEGHRLGDMRRLSIPLNPAAGTAYPGGGGQYGTQTCFALPDVERVNNPNIPK